MRIHVIVAMLLCLVALPLAAQSNEVGVWYSTAQLKDTGDAAGRLTFDNAKGYGVSFNHFWTGALSTEFSATRLHADGGIEVNGARVLDTGRLKLMPITADVQWHFAHSSMISPYIGAGLAYIKADDLSSSDLNLAGIGAVKIDKKTTWNAGAGIDFSLFKSFALTVDAKYIKYEPDSSAAGSTEKLKLNPLMISGGVKLRW